MEYKGPLNKKEKEDEILRTSNEKVIDYKNENTDENIEEKENSQVLKDLCQDEKLIKEANENKFKGNELFYQAFFDEAIISYQKALDISPLKAKHERAIYYANIAECYIRKKLWDQAVEACTNALKEDPEYIKALHRRAKANEKIGTWHSLDAALLDYEDIKKRLPGSSPIHKSIKESISRVKPILSEVQEREKTQMLNKLKDLGNNILGKFGLSTDNFKAVQDPQTGNYSISFQK
ncbi:hypothetical protein PNEG_02735 [Pneumocystis murina B123]|uniref:Uncharacterized protein n=1 Tax=Pneumocystis murina (strain B123) TaxID=1069680 RepID=M7NPD4_PNEMU|nr:hypothetical protein PNEG_02735 [Pneumocystis murina B123]EMR08956.1 hypothetical protein PNEG_02735 [Pneumocystis murina B123]